ncbi:MAG: hypothetical protein A3F16_05530 [Deltaproteobacteria bacterium RIFCSPHIGHO2_12_FULL_43_9]|nr:MAG: hypothetical protein A3F16_05530 [Deltaproteobacteria bacterium RIFCSPHIGHO2_12_FULL_43_9]
MPLKPISLNSLTSFVRIYSSPKVSNLAEEIIKALSGFIRFERGMIVNFLNGDYAVLFQSENLKNKIKEGQLSLFKQMRGNKQSILTNLIVDSSNLSILAVPLLEGEECVGLIYLDSKAQNYNFNKDDLDILENYSSIISPLLKLHELNSQNNELKQKLKNVIVELRGIREEFADQINDMKNELSLAHLELKKRYQFGNIVVSSNEMRKVITQAQNLVKNDFPVLICGEDGTGKELIAKTIHYQGSRFEFPFKVIDCSTISPLVAKSEFLGRRGKGRIDYGLFEAALNGTLFLRNIDQLDFSTQKIIATAINSKTFKPIGSRDNISFNIRVIASTTHNVESDKGGSIYPDLLNILKSNSLFVAPLKERIEDIVPLCRFFLRKISEEQGGGIKEISDNALKTLSRYPWPMNVAELEEELRKSTFLADKIIDSEHLPDKIKHPSNLPEMIMISEMEGKTMDQAVARIEKELVKSTLRKTRGNKAKTAKLLNISRTTLYEILK